MDTSSISNLAATATVAASTQPPPVTPDQRALIQAVKSVDSTALFGSENEVTFVRDRATNLAAVRIVNKVTGDIVAQLPPEIVLQMAEELKGTQA